MVEIDIDDLRIIYVASLSACDDCTNDDCGMCELRISQDIVSEILRENEPENNDIKKICQNCFEEPALPHSNLCQSCYDYIVGDDCDDLDELIKDIKE